MSTITVSETKSYMGITTSTDDTLIQTLINLATSQVEAYIDKKIEFTQVSGERLVLNRPDFDYAPINYFDLRGYRKVSFLKNNPVSGLSIVYDGNTLVNNEDYVAYLDSGYIAFLNNVDDSMGTLTATYQTGYGSDIPSGLKAVILDVVANKYRNHGAVKGEKDVKSKSLGEFSVTFNEPTDLSVYNYILNSYKTYDI